MLAKIFDDFLLRGLPDVFDVILIILRERFEFGAVTHGPGQLRFFGLNITKHDDIDDSIYGDDKLDALSAHLITAVRHRELESCLNSVEGKAFMSVSCASGWLGITASPFCALFSSVFQ